MCAPISVCNFAIYQLYQQIIRPSFRHLFEQEYLLHCRLLPMRGQFYSFNTKSLAFNVLLLHPTFNWLEDSLTFATLVVPPLLVPLVSDLQTVFLEQSHFCSTKWSKGNVSLSPALLRLALGLQLMAPGLHWMAPEMVVARQPQTCQLTSPTRLQY